MAIDEKEILATVEALPLQPPKESVEELKRRGFLNTGALVYKTGYWTDPLTGLKEKCCEVVCTECGKQFYLERVEGGYCHSNYGQIGFLDPTDGKAKKTEDCCLCPCCKAQARALHTSHIRNYFTIDYCNFITVHNTNGHLAVLMWQAQKQCTVKGEVRYFIYRGEGIIVFGNKLVRVTSEHRYFNSYTYYPQWHGRKRFVDMIGEVSAKQFLFLDKSVIEATESKHCAFAEYVQTAGNVLRPLGYMRVWCKYPHVENLVRCGYSALVNDMIDACTYKSYNTKDQHLNMEDLKCALDWKKRKPHEMLQLQKEDMGITTKLPWWDLRLYAVCKSRYSVTLPQKLLLQTGIKKELVTVLLRGKHGFYPQPLRLLNYLKKNEESSGISNALGLLRDYWDALYDLYGEISSKLAFPAKLKEAHDDMTARAECKANEEISNKIETRGRRFEKLSFADEETGLTIFPCPNQYELIREGKHLNHCVARYAKSIAGGKTSIFLVRKTAAPDTPFFTLEFKNGEIAQNHGYGNCDPTPEVTAFVDKWLEFIKNGGNKNGKPNNNIPKTTSA